MKQQVFLHRNSSLGLALHICLSAVFKSGQRRKTDLNKRIDDVATDLGVER